MRITATLTGTLTLGLVLFACSPDDDPVTEVMSPGSQDAGTSPGAGGSTGGQGGTGSGGAPNGGRGGTESSPDAGGGGAAAGGGREGSADAGIGASSADAALADAAGDAAASCQGFSVDCAPEETAPQCDDIACVHGKCDDSLGSASCTCLAGFAGELCDECARGYSGDACDECADGYLNDPTGGCVPDPCFGDVCHGHGTCIADGWNPVCRCAPHFDGDYCDSCATGYTGDACDECADGYSDPDGGGCQLTACIGVTCAVGGTCADVRGKGVGVCVCDDGHMGSDCGECKSGYSMKPDGHCAPTACDDIACSFGTCRKPDAGDPACYCDQGYTGDACDQCADGFIWVGAGEDARCRNVLPVEDGLHLWFDAADLGTFDFHDSGTVFTWWDKVTGRGDDHPRFAQGVQNRQPSRSTEPMPGVVFSNATHLGAYGESFTFLGEEDGVADFTVFVVAELSSVPTDDVQSILVGGNVDTFFKLSRTASGALVSSYYGTEDVPPDVTSFASPDEDVRQLMMIEHRPFLNGWVHRFTSSSGVETVESQQPGDFPNVAPKGAATMGQRLRTWTSVVEPFEGTMHEVLVYSTALSTAERDAVTAYLDVKWDL